MVSEEPEIAPEALDEPVKAANSLDRFERYIVMPTDEQAHATNMNSDVFSYNQLTKGARILF